MRSFKRIAVYCGSSAGAPGGFYDLADAVGAGLARRGIGVVYGGGRVGMMGRVADAALAQGGEVFGVIPERLLELELGHTGVTQLDVVPDMQTRKKRMMDLSDAFIALPGGYGTVEELFEVLTLTQLSYHDKPVGVLNGLGYFDGLLGFLDHARDIGFVRQQHRQMLVSSETLDGLLDGLARVEIPLLSDWAGEEAAKG